MRLGKFACNHNLLRIREEEIVCEDCGEKWKHTDSPFGDLFKEVRNKIPITGALDLRIRLDYEDILN